MCTIVPTFCAVKKEVHRKRNTQIRRYPHIVAECMFMLVVLLLHVHKSTSLKGGARGVMVIVVGNEHGDTSSNPGRD